MYNTTKKQLPKVVACMLALMMVLSIAPVELYTTALGAAIDKYYINVVDGENKPVADSTEITLTNKNDAAKTKTCTSINGTAVFEDFVEENEVYAVSVGAVIGYADVNAYDISVKSGDTATTVQLTALEKVTLSGIVTDENKKPYKNAGVELSGYITGSTTTDADGRYSFEVFKGKDYKLTAKADDKEYDVAEANVLAIAENTECNLSFKKNAAKPAIDIEFGKNGTVTEGTTENGDKIVKATADEGYYISSFVVNGVEQVKDNQREDNFVYTITDKSVDYKIAVSFAKKVYTVKLVVGENGTAEIIQSENKQSTSVTHGGSISIQVIPNSGYEISTIKMNDKDINVEGKDVAEKDHTYTINTPKITCETTIAVTFVKRPVVGDEDINLDFSEDANEYQRSEDEPTYVKKGAWVKITPKKGYKWVRVRTATGKVYFGAANNGVKLHVGEGFKIKAVAVTASIVPFWGYSDDKPMVITYDDNGPAIKANKNNSEKWVKGEASYTFSITDKESGKVQEVKCVDGENEVKGVSLTQDNDNYTFVFTGERNAEYDIEAKDINGNISSQKVKVMIDNTAPSNISLSFSPVEGSASDVIRYLTFGIFCKEKVAVTVKAQDSGSGVGKFTLCYNDKDKEITTAVNKNGTDYYGTFVIPGTFNENEEGVYFNSKISVTAEDTVGNSASVEPESVNNGKNHIMIETVKPTIQDLKDKGIVEECNREDGIYRGDIEFSFSASDDESGLHSVDIKINGNSIAGYPKIYTGPEKNVKGEEKQIKENLPYSFTTEEIAPDKDGNYNIEIVAIDNAGNESETAKLTIAKDQTSPVIQ